MAPASTVFVEPSVGDPVVLVSRERDLGGSEVLFELIAGSCTDNRHTGEVLLIHEPPQRDLRRCGVDLVGDRADLVEDFPAALGEIEPLEALVETPPRSVGSPDRFGIVRIGTLVFARQEATG